MEKQNEDYVSFEVAKLLKEKGYNHYQKQHYFTKDIHACDGAITIKGKALTDMFHLSDDFDDMKIYAPSLWDAQKWLREEYHIDLEVMVFSKHGQYYVIIRKDTRLIVAGDIVEESYEQALNEGIKEALKMI